MRPWSFRDKRDRVRQLRIFCEVVRAGTISGASERLGLTQPAVSLQVRDLEHEHGAILLERRSTGIGVTPAGRQLFALVEPLVQGVDGIFEDLPQSLGGPLAGGGYAWPSATPGPRLSCPGSSGASASATRTRRCA